MAPECGRQIGGVEEAVLQEYAVAGVEVGVRMEVDLHAAAGARRVVHERVEPAVSARRAAHMTQHWRALANSVPNLRH